MTRLITDTAAMRGQVNGRELTLMFKFIFSKEKQAQEALLQYLDVLKAAHENFQKAMEVYIEKGLCEDFSYMLEQTHKWESRADDIRYAIENVMYEKALLPESRGDILGLLESIDELPGLFGADRGACPGNYDPRIHRYRCARLDIGGGHWRCVGGGNY